MGNSIEYYIFFGDSLTDQGEMYRRKLFGLKSMKGISGLQGKSPRGRFTNGYSWNDQFITLIYENAVIQALKDCGKSSDDIADDIIAGDSKITRLLHEEFNLNNHKQVKFRKRDFVRSYNEGGVSAYDYSKRVTLNLRLFGTEKILSNLTEKRKMLLEDDEARAVTDEHKEKTLIIEWTGINDLITVNNNPTQNRVERAVQARINNVIELIHNGYCHFVLLNLPDFSNTPRYHLKSIKKQKEASQLSLYFNKILLEQVHELCDLYPQCSIDVFDTNQLFSEIYNNPNLYGFSKQKMTTPFTSSTDFILNSDGVSPAPGYMFWDDVHPTANLHALLCFQVYTNYRFKYDFSLPSDDLLSLFRETYGQSLINDQRRFFSYSRKSKFAYKTATLKDILEHALYEKSHRTREVLIELGWINKHGTLISDHPSLIIAMANVKIDHRQKNKGHTTLPP